MIIKSLNDAAQYVSDTGLIFENLFKPATTEGLIEYIYSNYYSISYNESQRVLIEYSRSLTK